MDVKIQPDLPPEMPNNNIERNQKMAANTREVVKKSRAKSPSIFLLIIAIGFSFVFSTGVTKYLISQNTGELYQKLNLHRNEQLKKIEGEMRNLKSDVLNIEKRLAKLDKSLDEFGELVIQAPDDSEIKNELAALRMNVQEVSDELAVNRRETAFGIKRLDNLIKALPSINEASVDHDKLQSTQNESQKSSAKVNFPFVLNSIENRSGQLFVVLAPPNFTKLSQLRFLAEGDVTDGWSLIEINKTAHSATFKKDEQIYLLTGGR